MIRIKFNIRDITAVPSYSANIILNHILDRKNKTKPLSPLFFRFRPVYINFSSLSYKPRRTLAAETAADTNHIKHSFVYYFTIIAYIHYPSPSVYTLTVLFSRHAISAASSTRFTKSPAFISHTNSPPFVHASIHCAIGSLCPSRKFSILITSLSLTIFPVSPFLIIADVFWCPL